MIRQEICSFFIKQELSGYGFWYLNYEEKSGKIHEYSGPHTYKEAVKALHLACIQHGHEVPQWAKPWHQRLKEYFA